MEKKNKNILLLVSLISIVIIALVSQTFTVFDFGASDSLFFDTPYLTSTARDYSYSLDNYTLTLTVKENEYQAIGCDTTQNWNCVCNLKLDYVDTDGCNIYSASRLMYKCPDGYVHNLLKEQIFPCYVSCTNCCYRSGNWRPPSTFCDSSYVRTTSGMRYNDNLIGHYFITKIYHNGILLDISDGEFDDGFTDETVTYYLTKDGSLTNSDNAFYRIYIGQKETDGDLKKIGGNFRITLQEKDFNWKIIQSEDIIYSGDDAKVILSLDNYIANFHGDLFIDYTIVTAIGNVTNREIMDVNVTKGHNEYLIDIPTEQSIDELIITPTLVLYYDAVSSWSDASNSFAGTIIGDEQVISVRASAERDVIELNIKLLSQEDELLALRELQLENARIINDMNLNLDDQIDEILILRQTTQENIILVTELQSEIGDQLLMIDGLTQSQLEKEEMIAQLLVLIDDENSKVNELVAELQGKDVEIDKILEFYQEELNKQSIYTSGLVLSNEEINEVLVDLNNNVLTEQEASARLEVQVSDLNNLIDEYEENQDKIQDITSKLDGSYVSWTDYAIPITLILSILGGAYYFVIFRKKSKKRGKKK